MRKILLFTFLISSGTFASKTNTAEKLSCKLSEKTFKSELGNVLQRPEATAELLWESIIRKPLSKSHATDLANNFRYYQNRLNRKLKRRARKFYKKAEKNNLYQASIDKKMDRLFKKVQESKNDYNSYILKNLRTRFAQNVSVKDKNGDFFNFGHNKDAWVEFKSDLFTKDLESNQVHDLNIDFFDRKDINGGLYNIKADMANPGIIEIGKKAGDESAALSDLVTGTINDGTYYELKANYRFSFGKKKPKVEYILHQYPSIDSDERPLQTKVFKEKELVDFVQAKNCHNGVAINKVPSIVDDTERANSKELDQNDSDINNESSVNKN